MSIQSVRDEDMLSLDGHLDAELSSQLRLREMHSEKACGIQSESNIPKNSLIGKHGDVVMVAVGRNGNKEETGPCKNVTTRC